MPEFLWKDLHYRTLSAVESQHLLVVALLIDHCSLPAPYTDINMSDALDDKLEREIYDTL